MPQSRIIRQQALQLLCQFDSGNCDAASITDESFDEETSKTTKPRAKAATLAKNVWKARIVADEAIGALTPAWPIHRQPLIDRNILRLAHFEIVHNTAPPLVAITEAIELAKEFGTAQSPAFVNGVLNEIMEQHKSDSDVEKTSS